MINKINIIRTNIGIWAAMKVNMKKKDEDEEVYKKIYILNV